MLFAIAWRNIWRNKTRSLIIMASIALGLLGGIVASSVSYGMADQMMKSSIQTRISHLQLHHPRFVEDRDLKYPIAAADSVVAFLRGRPNVAGVSARIVTAGMAASPQTATGVELRGVDPAAEDAVSAVPQSMVEGSWFDSDKRNPAVIGDDLAQKLGVDIGSKIVFTFQDASGTITGGAFRVTGLFSTVSSSFDKMTVFVRDRDLGPLLAAAGETYEIAVLLDNMRATDTIAAALRAEYGQLRVRTWRNLAPELEYMTETMDQMLYIFMAVIVLALAFGIINTMLMVVLERVRELGMLMAVGMKRGRIFAMIMLETVFLSMTGAGTGMLLSIAAIAALGRTGIDLSLFAQGLHEFGMAEILYPSMRLSMYPILALMMIATAVASSIYPALHALRLRPADALRMN
jgi:ABC-type lipoprotein release transport system permease subunit